MQPANFMRVAHPITFILFIFTITILLVGTDFAHAAVLDEQPFSITSERQGWEMRIKIPDFEIDRYATDDKGNVDLFGANEKKLMFISVFSKRAGSKTDEKECLDSFLKNLKRDPVNRIEQVTIKIKEKEPTLAYFVKEFLDRQIDQQNVVRCFVHGKVLVYVHLSKINFKSGEEKLFDEIMNTIVLKKDEILSDEDYKKFKEIFYDKNGVGNSLHHLVRGSAFYDNGDYKKAIPEYRKALQLNKSDQKLDEIKSFWYIAMDNLGIAYGVTGQLKRAERVFLEGLKRDPQYPMFYYNLAATYAEMGDLNKALTNLNKAYQYRENMLSTEELPDPTTDSSFKKFLNNPEFQKVSKKFKKAIKP